MSGDVRFRAAWSVNLRDGGSAVAVDGCASAADAHARIAVGAPVELVVLDADAVTPVSAAQRAPVTRSYGCSRVVVVGAPGDGGAVRAALESGARGFLFGRAYPAARPGIGRPPLYATGLARDCRVAGVDGVPTTLTDREVEIVRHAAAGETNIEIGRHLNLSPLTVKSHLSRIGRRLGTGDRARIVLLLLRAGAFA